MLLVKFVVTETFGEFLGEIEHDLSTLLGRVVGLWQRGPADREYAFLESALPEEEGKSDI